MTRARWPAAEERGAPAPIGHNGGPALEERSLENPTVSLGSSSPEDLLAFFGILSGNVQLPPVSIEAALEVPAVFCAVAFLSRSLASLPLHGYRKGTKDGEAQRIDGDLQMLLNEAPNPEWSSNGLRRYFWQQVFTAGRGLAWIERKGVTPVALWPFDPGATSVVRTGGRKVYRTDGKEYPAADVIDVPFMLKPNMLGSYSPIYKCRKSIALAIAMGDFAGTFFAGGGVPPLALEGPLPQGADAFKRAQADIKRAIDMAKKAGSPFFGMPPGHALKAIGVDPDKGQMTEARRFQLEEIARVFQLPPAFLQDLTHGTFTNVEQQDLNLVKHLIAQWAKAFEDEANLKLFGQRRRARYAEHSLDALMRGDFLSRINALARGIQTGQLMPDEARALENRPKDPSGQGAKLYMQGATVPLGTVPVKPASPGDGANDDVEGTGDAGQGNPGDKQAA